MTETSDSPDSEPPDSEKLDSLGVSNDSLKDCDFKLVFTPGLANYYIYVNGDKVSDIGAWDYMRTYERKKDKQKQTHGKSGLRLFGRSKDLEESLKWETYNLYNLASQAAEEVRHRILSGEEE